MSEEKMDGKDGELLESEEDYAGRDKIFQNVREQEGKLFWEAELPVECFFEINEDLKLTGEVLIAGDDVREFEDHLVFHDAFLINPKNYLREATEDFLESCQERWNNALEKEEEDFRQHSESYVEEDVIDFLELKKEEFQERLEEEEKEFVDAQKERFLRELEAKAEAMGAFKDRS